MPKKPCNCGGKSVVDRERLVERQTKAREDSQRRAEKKARELANRRSHASG